MKKILLKCALCGISLLLISCFAEEVVEPDAGVQVLEEESATLPSPSGGLMIGGLVQGTLCGVPDGRATYTYTVYATNYPAVNFDRIVNISIYKTVKGQQYELDGGDVIIPANATASNNLIVFSGANTERFENVKVQVLSVYNASGQNISSQYTLVNAGQYADNCYVPDPPKVPGDGPNPCGGEDADGDGICDGIDSFNDKL